MPSIGAQDCAISQGLARSPIIEGYRSLPYNAKGSDPLAIENKPFPIPKRMMANAANPLPIARASKPMVTIVTDIERVHIGW